MINIEKLYNFSNNQKIIVCVSGGPDSMALLSMLLNIRDKYNLSLIVAFVNHKVRIQSDEEEKYVSNFCKENNLIFESVDINDNVSSNFEAFARNFRFNYFKSLSLKYDCKYIMLAHHGDDLIETILMRIVRGSNLSGYGGFRKILYIDGIYFIRPLISLTKKDLLYYNEKNNIKYFVDKSNYSYNHTRNRFRYEILPFLKEEDSFVNLKFLKFSNLLYSYYDYVDGIVKSKLDELYIDKKLIIFKFKLLDDFIKKLVINEILYDYYKDDVYLLSDKHIDLIIDLINSDRLNMFIDLPNGVIACKSYGKFYLYKKSNYKKYSFMIDMDFNEILLPNGHKIIRINDIKKNGNDIIRLNYSDLKFPLVVRCRNNGDRIKLFNKSGVSYSKLVNKIFIDKKIPLEYRDLYPIVCDSDNVVVWIPNLKKSSLNVENKDKCDIILKYI